MNAASRLLNIISTSPIDERAVYGYFKDSSATDADVLYSLYNTIAGSALQAISDAKKISISTTILIVLLIISALGIIFIPFVMLLYVAAIYLRWWGRRRLRIIDSGYKRYLMDIGLK